MATSVCALPFEFFSVDGSCESVGNPTVCGRPRHVEPEVTDILCGRPRVFDGATPIVVTVMGIRLRPRRAALFDASLWLSPTACARHEQYTQTE
jgi:hypothetical protein